MKSFLVFALLQCYAVCSFAQKAIVHLRLLGSTEKKVTLVLPTKSGEKFFGSRIDKILNEENELNFEVEVNKIGFIQVINDGNYFKFYLEPGQTTITIDLEKKQGERVSVQGKNSEGLALINQKARAFYQSNAMAYYRADSTVAGITARMDSNHLRALKPYRTLLDEKKITSIFYQYVKGDIDQYYTAMLAHIPVELYMDAVRAKTFKIKDEFAVLWTKVYRDHPADDMRFAYTADFFDYAQYYANTYKRYYEAKLKGTYKELKLNDETDYLRHSYTLLSESFNGSTREYMLANFLYNSMLQDKYQLVLTELFQKFKATYPQSEYVSYLLPMNNKILNYHKLVKQDFTADQKFVLDYERINSLDELAGIYKDKTVFVDIWATWCGPCKAEFEYGASLDKFLRSKNAVMLYISMDKDAADQQWKEMIKFYKLSGDHVRTNSNLQQDLINRLWGGKGGYSIPRYLILKDGNLVVADALRPSDKEKLYKQIEDNL